MMFYTITNKKKNLKKIQEHRFFSNNCNYKTQTSSYIITDKELFRGLTSDNSHLVQNSPWPLFTSINLSALLSSFNCYMHHKLDSFFLLIIPFYFLIACLWCWWRDIVREGTYEGKHNTRVQLGLKLGMILFIVSEVMFFFSFFWAFFHSSIAPAITIGAVWPPKGINPPDALGLPLFNTILLLASGVFLTWSHHCILAARKKESMLALVFVIIWAHLFTFCQYTEYINSSFTISDSIYGSCFYMTTGFHGFHVIVGTLFLIVCLFRLIDDHFTREHHLGFESAAWYWHFVDVVWIFLYLFIYCFGTYI